MLNELITWVLNTYLGKYLEDFNPAQLSIALLSGEVELENVPIRRDALKSFGIPVQALSGSIGKIKLQVPVRQFRTSPWSIVIERVYGVFGPKDLSEWDDEKEKQDEYEYKLNILDAKEAAWRIENGCQSESYYSLSYSSWLNYGTTLATNILENLELKIIDVHLRYEDTLTTPKFPFTSGIRISSISAQSCDSNWTPGVKNCDINKISFKLLELNDLCVYWDQLHEDNKCSDISSKNLLIQMNNLCKMENHRFIIKPIMATGKFKRERCKEPIRNKNRPRISCDIVLPEVRISLNEVQYKEIVNCISNLHSISRKKMFKILKTNFYSGKDVKMLWKYALACHGFNFFSNEEKWKTARDNIHYIKIYKRLLVNPTENLSKEDKQFKIEMEKVRPLSELKLLRSISCENVSSNELNARNRNINQTKGILYHWFPNWLGWYASSPSSTNDESYVKIEDDILNALKETIENDTFSKRDVIFANFTFSLSNGSIHLTSAEVNSNNIALDLDFQNLISFVEVKPKFYSYCVGISLGSVCLNDMRTESTVFPNLIKPQIQENHKSLYKNFIGLFTKKSLISEDEEPWFQLQYEKNPVSHKSDFRLTVKSKSLDVVYNEEMFKWLISFFNKPIYEMKTEMYRFTEKYVQPPRLKIFKNWKSVLIGQKDYRKKWSFEIDISAPRIICVDNFKDKNSVLLLIDFGRFQLFKNGRTNNDSIEIYDIPEDTNSDDELFMTPCSTPPGSKTSRSNSLSTKATAANVYDSSAFPKFFINSDTGLENDIYCEIYDKYIINLTDLQVIVCKNRECGYVCSKTSSSFHLLDKFNISICIERRIINTVAPEYPAVTLFGKLQKIAAHVNEQKISECFRILNNISFDLFESNSQINCNLRPLRNDLHIDDKSDVKEDINTTLFQFAIDNMILEVQSREKSIAELQIIGAKASITKTTGEMNINMSVHGFLLVDAIQSFGPDFELLIASHRHVEMDSISGSLRQSEPCSPTSPASPDPNGCQRPTSPYIINKVVNDLQLGKGNCSISDEALITIDVNIVELSDDVEPIQLANITFNNLDVIANQETIMELLEFGKRILDNYKVFRSSVKKTENKAKGRMENSDQSKTTKFKTEISFDFHRLNILVPRSIRIDNESSGRKVGTLTMSEAKINASLGIENEICVAGALGGIQIIDITPEGVRHQRIFSVGKDPLTDPPNLSKKDFMYSAGNEIYPMDIDDTEFQYTNALSFKISKVKSSSVIVKVRMASVWYTHCPRFIEEVYLCVKEFKQYLKNFVKSLRNRATNMAKGLVHHISSTRFSSISNKFANISFDVILNSPVLVLPRSCQSPEVFVANLGKFAMNNTFDHFEKSDDSIRKDTYFLDITHINLFSLNICKRSEVMGKVLPKANELYCCKTDAVAILYDTAVLFRCIFVTKPLNVDTGWNFQQTFQIDGSVTQNLNICLTKSQYEQLYESLNYATSISILSDTVSTLKTDADPLVKKSVAVTSKPNEYENIRFQFSVPILKLDLKNEFEVSIIHIIFKEFNFEKNDTKEKSEILISLRSVIMEDLKCSQNSKHRNMVDSSSENDKKLSRKKLSNSCPNISGVGSSIYIDKYKSMPAILTDGAFIDVRTTRDDIQLLKKIQLNTNRNEKNLVCYKSVTIKNNEIGKQPEIKCSIDFNNLNLIVSIEKWFMVFDFFGLITNQTENSGDGSSNNHNDYQNTFTRNLQITIRSLNLILVRNESELTKANISNVTFHINKSEVVNSISGRLGSISVCDLTPFGRIYQEKFSTTGPEALRFKYKRIRKNTEAKCDGGIKTLDMDAELLILMSSVRYVHTKRFIVEIHLFIQELLQLQSPVMNRLKRRRTEREKNNSLYKIGLEVHAESPIILLPVSYNSNHLLIADLGKLTIVNSFHFSKDLSLVNDKRTELIATNEIVELMNVDLVNINVVTGQREVINKNNSTVHNNCNILCIGDFGKIKLSNTIFKEKCHLKLQIIRNTESNISHNIPDIKVNATLTELNGVIDLQQYKLIRGFLNYNLGEMIEDVYCNYQLNLNESIEKLCSMTKINPTYIGSNWITLSINFVLENVTISLAEFNQLNNHSSEPTFACIKFIKSTLEIDSFSDGSQDIDLISTEILVMDSREYYPESYSKNVFKYILKPSVKGVSQSSVQAEIHSRKRNGTSKYTILLNNMRIMAILDYLEKLNKFLQEEPYMPAQQYQVREQISHVSTPHELTKTLVSDNNSKYEFVLNITNSEIVFVENSEQIDTNAIILKSTTVFSYKPNNNTVPISIDINHLEIFSCILGSENESSLSIIDPFTLNMELRNKCFQIHLQNKIFLRISYNDAMLFSRIMQSLPKQTNKYNISHSSARNDFEEIAPLVAMGFKPSDCWMAMEINSFNINDAALCLSQQKYKNSSSTLEFNSITLNANSISVCIIDDCLDADVPLLEFSLSNLLLNQRVQNGDDKSIAQLYEGVIETVIAGNYYNRRLSGWEPIIEPWPCTVSWKFTKTQLAHAKRLTFQANSKQVLKVNITSTLIELSDLVRKNWTEDYFKRFTVANSNVACSRRRRLPFVPFALKNLTGEPLIFKIFFSHAGGITRTEVTQQDLMSNWISAQHNEIVPFDFGPQSKLRHLDSHKLNMHQILIQIHGWTLIGPISIDKVGTFFRHANHDMNYNKKTRIVFDISLVGSAQKLIIVRSALNMFNNTMKPFLLRMEVKNEREITTLTISPSEKITIPLRFVESLIYLKPLLDADEDYHKKDKKSLINEELGDDNGFCTNSLQWVNCSTYEGVQNIHSCYTTNKIPFHVLTEIKKDKYPIRDLSSLPGHTITILPPLRIKNLLCCDLLFKITGHIQGRINASEEIEIFSVEVNESFGLSITLDNYKLSGQLKIPMGHTGIVEPKLKLVDVLNRELFLRISIQSFQGKGMEIFIGAPIWLINKTGLPLIFRQEGTNQISSGQFDEHEHARDVSPLLFSFSDQEGSPLLEFRLGKKFGTNNPWCKSFGVRKEITFRELKAEQTKINYVIGVNVQRGNGLYSCTTFITLTPRFQMFNRSIHKLEFAQKCDVISKKIISAEKIIVALPESNFPFHWPNCEQEPLLCVRIVNQEEFSHWSSGIPVNEAKSLYINVRDELGEMSFLRLEVILLGGTYILNFTDAYTLPPPIRIDNFSDVSIYFSQKSTEPVWRTNVKSQSSLSYVMDNPLGPQILLIEAPGGNFIEHSLKINDSPKSITYANFIYIAFKETFKFPQTDCDHDNLQLEAQQLVLGVKDKRVIIMKKCTGDRTQLWLMNSFGQLEHEGSSPPSEFCKQASTKPRLVLDLEKPPNPTDYTRLVVRPQNNQRVTTQTWRFENGRLMCHANMCVQAANGIYGLRHGCDAVLGKIEINSRELNKTSIPIEQNIEIQKLRPGSGHLEVFNKMDGPIKAVQIYDVKTKLDAIILSPDPSWSHASVFNKGSIDITNVSLLDELVVKFTLIKGFGVSVVSRSPCEELVYMTFENIIFNIMLSPFTKSLEFKVGHLQIDNQLLETQCPTVLYTLKPNTDESLSEALMLKAKLLASPNKNAVIFEYFCFEIMPCTVIMDEKLILKSALFLGYKKYLKCQDQRADKQIHRFDDFSFSKNTKRYYFENFTIAPTQVRLSVLTASKLNAELFEMKNILGLTLIKFEDAVIEFDRFSNRHHFETLEVYTKALKAHYLNQLKWHAASILGSVDFLGNPLGFANDLSEGVSGLIFEGSVKSLVKNVTHGISNSTAKLTETISDSLGRVVLDEHDNETRQKILEVAYPTSGGHLAAGLKGFGFGLLGGVTSIVRHTYVGAQSDGIPGFLSGLGKGIVGTITKPIIGVLDLAAETASAVRETSRGSQHCLPDRKRLPRCVTGAPGGLLPCYSCTQSKGQQYLYIINRRNFDEKLIYYEPNLCNDKEAQLRLLVSTEYVRIFSRCEEDPAIMFECHLSEVLSCHPLTTNTTACSKVLPNYYIEISTNVPKVTRPRIRCQSEEIAERASRCVNYAKAVFDERELSVITF